MKEFCRDIVFMALIGCSFIWPQHVTAITAILILHMICKERP